MSEHIRPVFREPCTCGLCGEGGQLCSICACTSSRHITCTTLLLTGEHKDDTPAEQTYACHGCYREGHKFEPVGGQNYYDLPEIKEEAKTEAKPKSKRTRKEKDSSGG